MKKMRNAKRLVLLTALCAIISYGAAGGGAGDKTSDNTPTPTNPNKPIDLKPVDNNPTPVEPAPLPNTVNMGGRYTQISFSKINDDMKNYKFEEKKTNKFEIGKNQYGYKLQVETHDDSSGFTTIDFIYSTQYDKKMTIKDGGIGLDVYAPWNNWDFNFSDKFDIVRAIHQVTAALVKGHGNINAIDVKEGGTYITFNKSEFSLSDNAIKSLLDKKAYDIGTLSGIQFSGNGDIFKFKNSRIIIDQNVNLGTSTDTEYNKLMRKMINPKFYIKPNVKIIGNNDNLIGVRAIGARYYTGEYGNAFFEKMDGLATSENEGTIEMLGNNSIAVFLKGVGVFSVNRGNIIVNKNSVGIYAIYDEGDFEDLDLNLKINSRSFPKIYNVSNITIGENSTGMYLYTKYYNTKLEFSNQTRRSYTILSNEKNATGMVFNIGEEKSMVQPDIEYIVGYNDGDIKLYGDRSTGMYLTGKGKVTIANKQEGNYSRDADIEIGNSKDKKNPGIGMYSDNPNGTIRNGVYGSPFIGRISIGSNAIGMAGVNKTRVENNGEIIIKGDDSIGMYLSDGAIGVNKGTIRTYDSKAKRVIGVFVGTGAVFSNEGKVSIASEGGALFVKAGGVIKNYGDMDIGVGTTLERVETPTLNILSNRVMPVKKDLGIYVDSLGETNPIEGLANLGLKGAELLIGAEATEKTNATEVTVGKDVLDPFNKSIKESNIPYWSVGSGSLIWEADPEIKDNRVEKVTLRKQSYTKFADEETKDVAKGLDEKYVVASEKDKQIFNYMNTLKDAESLGKVFKETRGSQYINVQQRINQTDNLLDNQISSLQKDNVDKAGHHVETFFNKDKHDFKTDEVPNTTSTAFGASYLFNNTDSNWGIYGGVAINNYKFKDTARSKENITMFKLGGYKTFDLNSVDWTLGGDVFVSQNSMKRRIMGDKVYENKADYNAYGFSIKNEISKTYELGENGTIKPYGSLKLGYGSFGKIKEKDATMGLDVKGNSYYSVKPSAGIELGYAKQLTDKTKLKASLDLAYEHELGKIDHKANKMKLVDTNQTYGKLKDAKDENRGNFRSGVKVGLETGNFNFSVKGGYDTKDKNAHIGVGIGASF
ncbi:autotransporter outer membrane beta-barrel domain-containing protein [Leptotrichia buccalis]